MATDQESTLEELRAAGWTADQILEELTRRNAEQELVAATRVALPDTPGSPVTQVPASTPVVTSVERSPLTWAEGLQTSPSWLSPGSLLAPLAGPTPVAREALSWQPAPAAPSSLHPYLGAPGARSAPLVLASQRPTPLQPFPVVQGTPSPLT